MTDNLVDPLLVYLPATANQARFSAAKTAGISHIAAMDEDDLEIVVTPGNWKFAGGPERWNWQVRKKGNSKFLVKGVASGAKRVAELAAKAAKAKLLARIPM